MLVGDGLKLFSKFAGYLRRAGEVVQYGTECDSENIVPGHSRADSKSAWMYRNATHFAGRRFCESSDPQIDEDCSCDFL